MSDEVDVISKLSLEKPKKKRKGTRKSRTGCLTCKVRRIKCDESKPACSRCFDTGRHCDFLDNPYHSPFAAPSKQIRSIRASPSTPIVVTCYQLRPKPTYFPESLETHEINHLEYFHVVCTQSILGCFDDSLWKKSILQISHAEPSIRSAVIALSSLLQHQASNYRDPVERYPEQSTVSYLNALQALNRRLDDSECSWELALIGSLLFAVFEALSGKDIAAIQHLQSGFAILKEFTSKFLNPSQIVRDVARAFTRFDTQACTFGAFYKSKPGEIPLVPPHFATVMDARETLDCIISYIYCLFKGLGESARSLPYKALPPSRGAEVKHVEHLLLQWSLAFKSMIASGFENSFEVNPKVIACKILQIQHLTATIYLSTLFYRDQLAFDAFTKDFTKIVDLATSVLKAQTALSGKNGGGKETTRILFSFDIGIIQPLYFTACKCRNHVLRRRAVDLLKKSGIEGLWDGSGMAAVAEWIIKHEEESAEEGESGDESEDGFIAETSRLREVGISIDRVRKSMRILSSRRGSDGVVEFVAGDIGWGPKLGVDVESEGRDEDGLKFWIDAWRAYVDGSTKLFQLT